MGDIKLGRLPDRTPVKLALSVSPELHRSLSDYADFYDEAYGEAKPLGDLVPAMLEGFLAGDRAFQRRQRAREGTKDERSLGGLKLRRLSGSAGGQTLA